MLKKCAINQTNMNSEDLRFSHSIDKQTSLFLTAYFPRAGPSHVTTALHSLPRHLTSKKIIALQRINKLMILHIRQVEPPNSQVSIQKKVQ